MQGNPMKAQRTEIMIERRTRRLQFLGAILGIIIAILGFLGFSGKASSLIFPPPATPTPPIVTVAGIWQTPSSGDDHGEKWKLTLTQQGKTLGGKITYTPNLNIPTEIPPPPSDIHLASYSYQGVVKNGQSTLTIDDTSATALANIVAEFETIPNCTVTFSLSFANADPNTMSGSLNTDCSDNKVRAITFTRS